MLTMKADETVRFGQGRPTLNARRRVPSRVGMSRYVCAYLGLRHQQTAQIKRTHSGVKLKIVLVTTKIVMTDSFGCYSMV